MTGLFVIIISSRVTDEYKQIKPSASTTKEPNGHYVAIVTVETFFFLDKFIVPNLKLYVRDNERTQGVRSYVVVCALGAVFRRR